MALTQVYVDPAINGDSGTGTIGDPFGDLQYALNTVTRDTTNGNQINVKAGTAEMLTATLSMTTYGTPTSAAPLVIRGYTSAANDGGIAEIRATGAWSATPSIAYTTWRDLKFSATTAGNFFLVNLNGSYTAVINCTVDLRASGGGVVNSGISFGVGVGCRALGCAVISVGYLGISSGSTVMVADCYIVDANSGSGSPHVMINVGSAINVITGNILVLKRTSSVGVDALAGSSIVHNVVYQTTAGTEYGLNTSLRGSIYNNIIVGFSGSGGRGVLSTATPGMCGPNAFFNCASNNSVAVDDAFRGAADVALAADPFTDAANGDFSLTTAAKAALRSAGWPSGYLGAHANSDPHITIGAVQYGAAEAGGGAVSISPYRGNF